MGLLKRGNEAVKYRMRERVFDIGDDAWIENEAGERAFKVDGKALRLRQTFVLEDSEGREVATVQQKMMRLRDSMKIERDGETVAVVKRALIAPFRDKFEVELDGRDWEVHGNVLDHEYEISCGRDRIATISKRWFSVRDTYGIEIEPGSDEGLVLAVAVAVDEMRRGD